MPSRVAISMFAAMARAIAFAPAGRGHDLAHVGAEKAGRRASAERNTTFSHMSCSMSGESFHSTFVLANASARACGARRDLLVALAEDDPRQRIHVHHGAVAAQRRVDLRPRLPSPAICRSAVERLEVRHAVQLRNDDRLAVHRRRDGIHAESRS
jgi:hypothetical protein